jgi:hypothetical protein
MTLIPMISRCVEVPQPKLDDTAILWRLPPDGAVSYRMGKQQLSAHAGPAGILRLSAGVAGKVCTAR